MAYEPTNWKTGDVVTSAKLNKLENAVAGNVLVINETLNDGSYTLDKTWEEIYNVLNNGGIAIVHIDPGVIIMDNFISIAIVYQASKEAGSFGVTVKMFRGDNDYTYYCESASGYPSRSELN